MIAALPPVEPPVRTYARLLHQLHALIAAGRGDSPEADELADEMDAPGYALTEQERERVGGLSEDLYALAEGMKQVPMSPEESDQWWKDLREDFNAEAWDRALEKLRRPPADASLDVIAFFQARCWEHLGDPETALAFMQQAERLNPVAVTYVMMLQQQLNRFGEAIARAQRILDAPDSSVLSLYFAASVLFSSAGNLATSQARPLLERIAVGLRRALPFVRQGSEYQRLIPEIEAAVTAMLGVSLERLGNTEEALRLYDEALARNPAAADILAFRGIARYEIDRTASLADFEAAAQLSASSVLPYYFLAHHALRHRDYPRCQALCQSALGRTTDATVLAQLHEWLGICRAMLGAPAAAIRSSFDLAERFDPFSGRIVQNRALADTLLNSTQEAPQSWLVPPRVSVEESREEWLRQQKSIVEGKVGRSRELVA